MGESLIDDTGSPESDGNDERGVQLPSATIDHVAIIQAQLEARNDEVASLLATVQSQARALEHAEERMRQLEAASGPQDTKPAVTTSPTGFHQWAGSIGRLAEILAALIAIGYWAVRTPIEDAGGWDVVWLGVTMILAVLMVWGGTPFLQLGWRLATGRKVFSGYADYERTIIRLFVSRRFVALTGAIILLMVIDAVRYGLW